MRVPFKSRIKVKTLPHGVVGSLGAEYASVAQLAESTTDNRVVTGPNPVVCTIRAERVLNLPTWSDAYDCSVQFQKRGYSNRLVGVSFRISPNNKTGTFYLRR